MRDCFCLAAFAGALALTGCDQQEAGPVDSEVSPTNGADDEQTLPGERSLADETVTGPMRAERQFDEIPETFLGVWDYARGSCMPSSDLRMEIEPQRITFYESVGEVTEVTPRGEDAVAVELDMEGEGENWENTLLLTLSDDGRTLTPSDGGEAADDPLPRKRCE